MNEEKKAPGASAPEEQSNNRRRRLSPRRVLAGLLSLAVVLGGLLAVVYRDRLTEDSLKDSFGLDLSSGDENQPFSYETGAKQVFAPVGNGFAVASSSSLQLLDERGKTVFKELVSFESPAVFSGEDRVLFCDLGGTGCLLVDSKGEAIPLEIDGDILSANINSSGFITVISEAAGYKGLVQVYDSQCRLVYRWWSGTAYALKASVSPDSKRLAVLSVGDSGSELHFFSLSSEDELCSASFPGELLFDMYYMADGSVCAISEENAYFVSSDGEMKGSYNFGGLYLSDYSFSSGSFALICLNSYRTGSGGTLISLDSSGEQLGSAVVEGDILSLSVCGEDALLLCSGELLLFGKNMELLRHEEDLTTAKSAILRPKGDILLLSAYVAEEFRF